MDLEEAQKQFAERVQDVPSSAAPVKEQMTEISESIQTGIGKLNSEMISLSQKTDTISGLVSQIYKRVSPKTVEVASKKEGESSKKVQYDPMAPEGRRFSVLSESGKKQRYASEEEEIGRAHV